MRMSASRASDFRSVFKAASQSHHDGPYTRLHQRLIRFNVTVLLGILTFFALSLCSLIMCSHVKKKNPTISPRHSTLSDDASWSIMSRSDCGVSFTERGGDDGGEILADFRTREMNGFPLKYVIF